MASMTLEQWLDQATTELGIDDMSATGPAMQTLLDLARDAAHGVARVAAPLTTFVAGVAVGRGLPLDEVAARLSALLPADGADD